MVRLPSQTFTCSTSAMPPPPPIISPPPHGKVRQQMLASEVQTRIEASTRMDWLRRARSISSSPQVALAYASGDQQAALAYAAGSQQATLAYAAGSQQVVMAYAAGGAQAALAQASSDGRQATMAYLSSGGREAAQAYTALQAELLTRDREVHRLSSTLAQARMYTNTNTRTHAPSSPCCPQLSSPRGAPSLHPPPYLQHTRAIPNLWLQMLVTTSSPHERATRHHGFELVQVIAEDNSRQPQVALPPAPCDTVPLPRAML